MDSELPLWVGITTLPSRINRIKPTLDSLLDQTLQPNRICLSLPMFSIRDNCEYIIPEWLNGYPKLQIIRCDTDYGPGTKLLGCLTDIHNPGCLIVADDDMIYRPFFLENLYKAQIDNLHASFSFWTYKLGPITIGQGADGFSFYTPNLIGLTRYSKKLISNEYTRVVDDLWISAYLAKNKIEVRSVRNSIPDDKDVYVVSHKLNQLQDRKDHLNREAANEQALKYLMLRGYLGLKRQLIYIAKALIRNIPGISIILNRKKYS